MNRILPFVILIACVQPGVAGQPKAAENEFIKVEVADQTMKTDPPHGSSLGYAFSFRLKNPIHLTRVRVEDITTGPSIVLVDDRDPKLKRNDLWTGNSTPAPFTPQNFPWMFDGRNSKRLVKITVSSTEAGEFSLNQPMLFDRSTKNMMLRFEQGSHKPKKSG